MENHDENMTCSPSPYRGGGVGEAVETKGAGVHTYSSLGSLSPHTPLACTYQMFPPYSSPHSTLPPYSP